MFYERGMYPIGLKIWVSIFLSAIHCEAPQKQMGIYVNVFVHTNDSIHLQ